MRKKIWWIAATVLLLIGVGYFAFNREQPTDTRYTGAYRFDDGTLVVIGPRDTTGLRFKLMNGNTGALWPTDENGNFEGGEGWAQREPVTNRVQFQRNSAGDVVGLTWQRSAGDKSPNGNATRVPLREETVTFASGELTLRGKLILPEGQGPFPVMIPVHGSEAYSAVEHYSDPYIYAANGIAAFIYDKRGTGGSEGSYTQNFHVLSDDTVAAVQYVRKRPEIQGENVHLAGYSQGGWIAPLAALKDGHIRSIFVAYGVAVPVLGEDRWGYVYALQQHGFGEKDIAEVDSVAAILGDIFDRGENRWSDLSRALRQARSKPWFETAKNSDSIVGVVASSEMPLWAMRSYMWWKYGRSDQPYIDRLYDPVQTLAKLDVPSLWVFAGEDSSAPTQWSIDALSKLQADQKPIEYFIYPDAEHGILRFEQKAGGERVILGYEADYFRQQLDWFRKRSGLL